ncbi:lactate utilization protein [Desulfobotulus sp. H1]|uniref:Lactate utilization protein n=1 Tax=Desulfobotulus pelophilus TaxID=2823377 RepID=A0ABT3N582_9BACT|nr:lactate utilization protein [Desulfobotulus pelophilus]MCW7752610.1 lactate utilization protein [Desulfobotulus pelophilus]
MGNEILELFKEKAEAVQGVISTAETIPAIAAYAVNLTAEQGGKTIAVAGFAPDQLAELLKVLKDMAAAKDIEVLEPPFRPQMHRIHTGLTPASWGIAQTGTLVLHSTEENLRIATMLSETHVCVLDPATIYPSTDELTPLLDAALKENHAAYMAFITGPSRTADIERVLSIGVHGPEFLHIILREEKADD